MDLPSRPCGDGEVGGDEGGDDQGGGTHIGEELQVLLHEGEVGLVGEPGVEELVGGAAGVVGPVAGEQEGQGDPAGAVAWGPPSSCAPPPPLATSI